MKSALKNLALSKFPIAILAAGMLFSVAGMAADEVTARAIKLYEQHHYEEASQILRPEMAGMESSRQASSSLVLGMIHLGNAKLYRELYQTALIIELDYLKQLSKQKTGTSSRMVEFYLGKALLETGKTAEAASYLQRFADRAGVKQNLRSIATAELGLAYSRQKLTGKASQTWLSLDSKNSEIKAALAAAYAAAGVNEHKPVTMADAVMSDAKAQHNTPDAGTLRNLLRAYSQTGATDKALDLLSTNEFKNASYIEDLGASKSIGFYDLSILEDMARANLDAAVVQLERASGDSTTANSANFFLADAYLQQGKAEIALRTMNVFISQTQMPAQYLDVARIRHAGALYKVGQRTEAAAIWQTMVDTPAVTPAVLAEVVETCALAKADCAKFEKSALAVLEKGDGKKYFPLSAALGKYYLLQKDFPRAVMYMEAGRDKANKNKIEVNDPAMLIDLAEAYYRNKNFSESLEIYFELGKQYPVVRQIQEAIQGIYSVEQKSAGDVKIY